MTRAGLFAAFLLCVSACAAPSAPTAQDSTALKSAPTSAPPAKPEPTPPAAEPSRKFDSPVAMLGALEAAGDTIRTFRAGIIYERVDAVSENRERRTGQIVLAQKPMQPESRTLAIVFDQFIDASGHASPERQRFLFAGGWLLEFDDARRQLIERELVPPGEQLDPLRIGEGPVPIPIGQKKDEVARRFEVKFAPPPTEPLLKRLENIQGLALKPKPNAGVDPDLGVIKVWYDLTTLMPVAVEASTRGGDKKILLLNKIELNKELDEAARTLLSKEPPAAVPGAPAWRRDVRPYKATPKE
ncbi:MAG: hypothetical protein K8R92_08015 [Planctomycetes bacterium]|nr:hypothetical protein [Planctomycetota bacterium]